MAGHDHILRQFDRDLITLRDRILLMAGMVEEHIASSMRALGKQDLATAMKLVKADKPVNLLEMECDELCIRMIVLRQPVASDVRFLVAALKIIKDLERIGDLAVRIAERAQVLAPQPKLSPPLDLSGMAANTQAMLKDSLDAFVRGDAAKAEEILARDDLIDAAFRDVFATLIAHMKRSPDNVERAVGLMFIAKHLERIADHSTNIAEMVIYLVKGKDVRHKFSVENP
jgi:phosphate transport system protein